MDLVCELDYSLTGGRSGFGGLGVRVLAFSTQIRGIKPGRSRRIFKGEKNPQHAFLRRGSKAVGCHVVDLRHVKDA